MSNVEGVRPAGGRSLEVVFGARWEGAGDPQPQECVVTVTDDGGQVVAEEEIVLYAQDPIAGGRQEVGRDRNTGGRPSSAEVHCQPLS